MGEGFGADEADGGDEGVGGWEHGVFDAVFLGLSFDRGDNRLDFFVTGLLADELHEFPAFVGVRCS